MAKQTAAKQLNKKKPGKALGYVAVETVAYVLATEYGESFQAAVDRKISSLGDGDFQKFIRWYTSKAVPKLAQHLRRMEATRLTRAPGASVKELIITGVLEDES